LFILTNIFYNFEVYIAIKKLFENQIPNEQEFGMKIEDFYAVDLIFL